MVDPDNLTTSYSSDANGLAIYAGVDVLGNLVGASATPGATPPDRNFQYDQMYRLSGVNDASATSLEAYTYGATGDRLSKAIGGGTAQSYAYTSSPASHRLTGIDSDSRSYDANGNTTLRAGTALYYDDGNLTQREQEPRP